MSSNKEVQGRDQVTPNTPWSLNSSGIDLKKVDKNRNNRILGSAFEIHVKCEIHFHQSPDVLDCPR